jgi:hypothetical protein
MASCGPLLVQVLNMPTVTMQFRHRKILVHILSLLAIIWSAPLSSSGNELGLFEESSLLEISIETDLETLLRKKEQREDQAYPGKLKLSPTTELDILVSPRGGGRRWHPFPPLKIKFVTPPRSGVFAGIKELKIVTHSFTAAQRLSDQERSMLPKDMVVREYLVFKMNQLFTERSFKTRLSRVAYFDTSTQSNIAKEVGFFYEDTGAAGKRLGLKSDKTLHLDDDDIEPKSYLEVAFFKWMVADFDWAIEADNPNGAGKNVEIFRDRSGSLSLIPKDFDYSRLVRGGPFSLKDNLKGLPCLKKEDFDSVLGKVLKLEKPFLSLFQNELQLSEASRIQAVTYLDDFYQNLRSGTVEQRLFEANCKMMVK